MADRRWRSSSSWPPSRSGPRSSGTAAARARERAATRRARSRSAAIRSYDPFGNNHVESPTLVPNATDGNPDTYWSTETYYNNVLGKPGVGIVLDAGSSIAARTLTVTSATPGYQAVIRSSNSTAAGFTDDSTTRTGGTTTTFDLDGKKARYYLIWITSLGGRSSVRINEVKATR